MAAKNIDVLTVSPGYVKTQLSVNAVNGDGSKYGQMDETTSKGMSPSALSTKVLHALVARNSDVLVADAKSSIGVYIKAIMPDIFAKIVRLKS